MAIKKPVKLLPKGARAAKKNVKKQTAVRKKVLKTVLKPSKKK